MAGLEARVRLSFWLKVAVSLLISVLADGQELTAQRFEVASVKPGGDAFSTKPERSAGRLRWTTQLCYLIGYAYSLDFSRVTSSKCGEVFAIETVFGAGATEEEVRLMVRSLLADRFKMRAHRVSTEANGYALSIGKGGFKMMEDGAGDGSIAATMPEAGVIAIAGHGASMGQLAATLGRVTRVPVWDRTGLVGRYSFVFRFADANSEAVANAASLGTALQGELGLKLGKQKGAIEGLVVDSIEEPSAN